MSDEFFLNGVLQSKEETQRITPFFKPVTQHGKYISFARKSENNFPTASVFISASLLLPKLLLQLQLFN
jgi:mevalonate pyrophosphate decarboxylase